MQFYCHLMLGNFISYQRSKAKNKAKFCCRAGHTNSHIPFCEFKKQSFFAPHKARFLLPFYMKQ